jgi:hypothetical protein
MQTEWMDFVLKLLRLVFVDFPTVAIWPITVIVLGLALRHEFKELLSRAIEVGPRGLKAVPPIQLQQPLPGEALPAAPEFNLPPAAPALAEVEARVMRNIRDHKIDQAPIEKQREIFVREFSELVLRSQFQFIGSQIFRSQFELLRRLSSVSPVSRKVADEFFEDHVRRVEEAGIAGANFDAWMAFLTETNLVERSNEGTFGISTLGKAFVSEYAPAADLREGKLKF